MPGVKEQSWKGFVCPGCRVIFRVPRDHTGGSVGCPSCAMQLRLPLQMNRVDPRVSAMPEPDPNLESNVPGGAEASTGSAREGGRSRRGIRRPLGLVLGVLLLGAVAVAVLQRSDDPVVLAPVAALAAERPAPSAGAAPGGETADSFETTVARALQIEVQEVGRVRQFLAARTAEDYAPLVREPQVALPRIREFLAANPPRVLGLRSMKVSLAPGGRYLASLTLEDFSTKRMILEEARDGVRVDWEAWVGWSSMPWAAFKESKPREPQLFRVTAAPVSYYNYEFVDEQRWSAWMLSSPRGDEFLYGYVARNSPVEAKLITLGKRSAGVMTLMLAFPPNATTNSMCEITEVVAGDWAGQSANPTSAPSKP